MLRGVGLLGALRRTTRKAIKKEKQWREGAGWGGQITQVMVRDVLFPMRKKSYWVWLGRELTLVDSGFKIITMVSSSAKSEVKQEGDWKETMIQLPHRAEQWFDKRIHYDCQTVWRTRWELVMTWSEIVLLHRAGRLRFNESKGFNKSLKEERVGQGYWGSCKEVT